MTSNLVEPFESIEEADEAKSAGSGANMSFVAKTSQNFNPATLGSLL